MKQLLLAVLVSMGLALVVGELAQAQTQTPVIRTYPVSDLVVPVRDFTVNGHTPHPMLGHPGQCPCWTAHPCPPPHAAQLMHALIRSVEPETWCEHGGEGIVEFFPQTLSLVIRQSQAVHHKVAAFLQRHREEQEPQVVFEIRLVQIPTPLAQMVKKVKINPHGPTTGCTPCGQDIFTQREAARFLAAALANERPAVLTAPKITTLNGQRASLRLHGLEGTPCNEIEMEVKPSVAQDRRAVNVDLHYQMTTGKGPIRSQMRFNTTRLIPDGQTFITGGWKLPHQGDAGVPVLNKIPYVHRLFRCCDTEKPECDMVLMVTPRILVEEEPEQIQPARHVLPPKDMPVKSGPGDTAINTAENAPKVAGCCEKVTNLLNKYHKACQEGDTAKAKKFGKKALKLDPTCFSKVK